MINPVKKVGSYVADSFDALGRNGDLKAIAGTFGFLFGATGGILGGSCYHAGLNKTSAVVTGTTFLLSTICYAGAGFADYNPKKHTSRLKYFLGTKDAVREDWVEPNPNDYDECAAYPGDY